MLLSSGTHVCIFTSFPLALHYMYCLVTNNNFDYSIWPLMDKYCVIKCNVNFSLYVHRSTGAYIQILFQILIRDMIQFGTIFSVFLFSFSGAFYLALRGEVRGQEGTSSCVDCNFTTDGNESMAASEAAVNTSLNIYPFETSYVPIIISYCQN